MTSRTNVIVLVVATVSSLLLLITYTDRIQTYSFLPDLALPSVNTTLCSVWTASCAEANRKQTKVFSPRGRNAVKNELFIGRKRSQATTKIDYGRFINNVRYTTFKSASKNGKIKQMEQKATIKFLNSQSHHKGKKKSQRRFKGRLFNNSKLFSSSTNTTHIGVALLRIHKMNASISRLQNQKIKTIIPKPTINIQNSQSQYIKDEKKQQHFEWRLLKSSKRLSSPTNSTRSTTTLVKTEEANASVNRQKVKSDNNVFNSYSSTLTLKSYTPTMPSNNVDEQKQSQPTRNTDRNGLLTNEPSHDEATKRLPDANHSNHSEDRHQVKETTTGIPQTTNRTDVTKAITHTTKHLQSKSEHNELEKSKWEHSEAGKSKSIHASLSECNATASGRQSFNQSLLKSVLLTTPKVPGIESWNHRQKVASKTNVTSSNHRALNEPIFTTNATIESSQSKHNTTLTPIDSLMHGRRKAKLTDETFDNDSERKHHDVKPSPDGKPDETGKGSIQTYYTPGFNTTKSPRFMFPQTLDFNFSSKERNGVSMLWLLGDIWRGRNLHRVMKRLSGSNFETDYHVLERHMTTGGLNLTRLSLTAWPRGAILPWEMDILETPPLRNLRDDSSYRESKVTLLDRRETYAVGDIVRFRIDVHDGHGRPRNVGGDEVRLWLVESAKLAAVCGSVTDFNNGSYLGEAVIRWPGAVEVKVELTFSKAAIRLHHYFRHVTKCPRFVAAGYINGGASESTLCSPFPLIPGYRDLCNYSNPKYNTGWYCGKPRHANISCDNWTLARDMEYAEPFPFTRAESKLSKSLRQEPRLRLIPCNATLYVDRKKSQAPFKVCSSRNYSDSWNISKPRGYFLARRWIRTDCKAPKLSIKKLTRCLNNTTLVFTGDSNLLMLFDLMRQTMACILLEAPGTHWHRARSCTRPDLKFTMAWALHGFPAHTISDHWAAKGDFQWATTSLDAIPSSGRFVVVVHLFIHASMHHYNVFWTRLLAVRQAAEALLARNPHATVVIRGPHTSSFGWDPVLGGDMMGMLFRQLTVRAFEGLHHRVLFLDFWDMTIAAENPEFHPPAYINRAILTVLFGHVCSEI